MRAAVLLLLLIALPVYADPSIVNLTVTPQSAYYGENPVLSFYCISNDSAVQSVLATITGPDVVIPNITIGGAPNLYTLTLDKAYIDRVGTFSAAITCTDASRTSTQSVAFTISNVTARITDVQPKPLYAGDMVEVAITATKDGAAITSGMGFDIYVDGAQQQPRSVLYDAHRGWVIRADAPAAPGNHALRVSAHYDRFSAGLQSTLVVNPVIQFSIAPDKASVRSGDNVTLSVTFTNRGQMLPLNDFRVFLEGMELDRDVTSDARYYYAKIKMPDVAPSTYNIITTTTTNNDQYTAFYPVNYVVPVSGEFLDEDGKAMSVTIRFVNSSVEKLRMITNANGDYSGSIVPGVYTIEYTLPDALITLENAVVASYSDAVKYVHLHEKAPGIDGNDIYVFDAKLAFGDAIIELPYSEDTKLFKCSSWNSEQHTCRTSWMETDAYIDSTKKVFRITTTSAGAFAVGTRESITVNMNLPKTQFALREPVTMRGSTQDSAKNAIADTRIAVKLGNDVIGNLTTDSNGVFTIEFLAPAIEGTYPLVIYADKTPYLRGVKETSIDVQKTMSLSFLFPDTIRISAGNNMTKELDVVNTGQDDVSGIAISIDGLPGDYYTMTPKNFDIPAEGQQKVIVAFSVPDDAETKTYAATIKASGPVEKEKDLGFTVTQAETQKSPATGFAWDFNLPSIAFGDSYWYVVGAAIVIIIIFAAKKRKRSPVASPMNNNNLSDIKNHLKSLEKKKK